VAEFMACTPLLCVLSSGGDSMSVWKRIKPATINYPAETEKSNQKMFGSGRPDCCNLNRQKPQIKR
jgi:hypothetical protein